MLFNVLRKVGRVLKWLWKVGKDVIKRCFYGMASDEVYVREPGVARFEKISAGPEEIADLVDQGYRVLSPDPFREGEYYSHNSNCILGSKKSYVGSVKLKKGRSEVYDPMYWRGDWEDKDYEPRKVYRRTYEEEDEVVPDNFIPVDDIDEVRRLAMTALCKEHPEYGDNLNKIKVDRYAPDVLADIEVLGYEDDMADSKIYKFKLGNLKTELQAVKMAGHYYMDPEYCYLN